jgi:hypothetical protein
MLSQLLFDVLRNLGLTVIVICSAGLIFWVPALAVYPRLYSGPLLFNSAPVLSIGLMGLLGSLLVTFHLFSPLAVRLIFIMLTLISIFHGIRYYPRVQTWLCYTPATPYLFLGFLIVLPLIGKGLHGSMSWNDEVYSWNYWAVSHYFNEPAQWNYTKAPYPQMLPYLITFIYGLYGSIAPQGFVKALFFVFPWMILNLYTYFYVQYQIHSIVIWALIAWACVFLFGHHYVFYITAYADPLMTLGLVLSTGLFLAYTQIKNESLLLMSVVTGIIAAYTKQPALVWILLSLPICLSLQQRWIWMSVSMISGLFWIVYLGKNFQNNHGVMLNSWADRNIVEELQFVFLQYTVHKPQFAWIYPFLGYLGFQIFRSKKNPHSSLFWVKTIFLVNIIPSLIIWIFTNNYDLRGLMHTLAISGVLLICVLPEKLHTLAGLIGRKTEKRVIVCIILWVSGSFMNIHLNPPYPSNPFEGSRSQYARFFGKGGDWVNTHLQDKPEIRICSSSYFVGGFFYHHTPVARPTNENLIDLSAYLKFLKITACTVVMPDGLSVESGYISALIHKCPGFLVPITLDRSYLRPYKPPVWIDLYTIQPQATCHLDR